MQPHLKRLLELCAVINLVSLYFTSWVCFFTVPIKSPSNIEQVTCFYTSNMVVTQVYIGNYDVTQFVQNTHPYKYKRLSFKEPYQASSIAFKMHRYDNEVDLPYMLVTCGSSNIDSEWNFHNSTIKTGTNRWRTLHSQYPNFDNSAIWWTNTHSTQKFMLPQFLRENRELVPSEFDRIIPVLEKHTWDWVLHRNVVSNRQDLFAVL